MSVISSNSSAALSTPISSSQLSNPVLTPVSLAPVVVDTVSLTANTLADAWAPLPRSFSAQSSSWSTPTGSSQQFSGGLGANGLSLGGSFSNHLGPAGGGKLGGQAQLGPISLNGSAEGSYSLGKHQSGQGSLQVGPGGLNGSLSFQDVTGLQAQGKVTTGASLNTSLGQFGVTNSLEGSLLIGSRSHIGGASLGGLGLAPGHGDGPASLRLDSQGIDINAGFSTCTGVEAALTNRTQVQTPVGHLNHASTLRASYGAGATGAVQFQSTQQRFALGAGGSLDLGPSLGVRNETGLSTPGGSGINVTSAASVGGQGGELSVGFVRDNNLGITSLGSTAILPIPGTPLQAGGGTQFIVTDGDLQGAARFSGQALGGPILGGTLGEAAASTVKPVMDTIPTVAKAVVDTNPVVVGARLGMAAAPVVVETATILANPIGWLASKF